MADVQRADEQDYDRRVGRGPVTPYAKRACELSLPDVAGVDNTLTPPSAQCTGSAGNPWQVNRLR
jgi:hypothetical protein